MATSRRNRLYAYVDESGQDTRGQFFVVSVVVLPAGHETLLQQLEAIEIRSRKRHIKWQRARFTSRQTYINELVNLPGLSQSLFFEIFRQTQDYTRLTVVATANAIRRKAQGTDQALVFIDGLRKHEAQYFDRLLRAERVKVKKVRGVQKEQNNAMIRLADALCGLVRDAEEGQPWAVTALKRLQRNGLVEAL